MPEQMVAGRYRVGREVGHGGMGSVWLCRDERLGRPVAIKKVGGFPGESSMHLARALREARHSAALSHPNVVAIFDAVEEGDYVWLVMEYVPSRTLDDIVRSDGPLAPPEAARIGADVADGLAAAHALGTVHRDVKPSNILVRDGDGRALIADFGIARTMGQEQLTRSGFVTGTPEYFAPELARGAEPSPASDVWALGVSLQVAVEGRPPYAEHPNAIAMLNTIASQPPAEPTRAGTLGPALHHMLERDPDARWTMAEAAQALRALAGPEPARPVVDAAPAPARGEPPPDTVPTAVGTPPQRLWARRRLVVAAVILITLMAAGGWWQTRSPDETAASDRPVPAATGKPSKSPSTTPAPATAGPRSSSSPRSPSTAPAGATAGSSPAGLVAYYYRLLPEDPDSAWDLLSPELQDEISLGTFEGFWATIDDVSVEGAKEVGDGLVQVTLIYTTAGRTEEETRQIGVERAGSGYRISDDLGPV